MKNKIIKKITGIITFFAIFLFSLFPTTYNLLPSTSFLPSAFAEDVKDAKEPIVVNGDRVEYLYEQKKIVGVSNVLITYKNTTLTCDRIEVDMETKEAVAEGNVVLMQKESTVRGEKVHYNFDTKQGTIIEAEARMKPWYGKGKEASKINDDEYVLTRGSLTTCDLPNPHYRVYAKQIKMYSGDRVEAYNVVAFIGKLPVFYFPYYCHILNDDRPRVTLMPGRNSTWGYYLLSAWRYYFHEWSRGYVHVDWREKKGVATGLDYKYKFGYFGKGLARVYYTHEDHKRTLEEEATGHDASDDRWRVQLRHKWQVAEDTIAVGEFNKMSDKLFIKDYFFNEEYAADPEPKTFFSVIRSKPEYNLSLYFRARTDDFFTVVERLPEAKLNVRSQRLANTDFYYKSSSAYALLQKKFDTALYQPKLRAGRFDTDHEISYLARWFKFLTFNPYAGVRETWYSEDRSGREDELRNLYTAGTKFSTKFHKVYDVKTDLLGLNIDGLKHVVTPMLDYKYISTPNIKQDALKRFDIVDGLSSYHGVNLEVIQRLQTKRNSVETILARLSTSGGVLFKERRIASDEREDDRVISNFLDEISARLELTPYPWLIVTADSRFSPEHRSIDTANVDFVARQEDKWKLGFGVRYEDDHFSGSSNQITTEAEYRISPKWNMKTYHRFKKNSDEDSFTLEEQNYGVERDLHCWLAELNYQIKQTDGLEVDTEQRVWLVMRLKAFPEMPFRLFSAKYSPPSPGVGASRSY